MYNVKTSAAWVFFAPLPSTTTISASPSPSILAQAVTFTAAVTRGATGTVTFTIDGAVQAPTTLISGQAQLTVSNLAPGSHTIAAAYSGDSSFLPSTSNTLTQVVNRSPLVLTLTSAPNPSASGQAATFTAVLAGGTGDYVGSVQFFDGGAVLGAGSVVNAQASFTTSALSAGSHSITAQYQRIWIWGTESAQGAVTQIVREPIRLSSAAAPIGSAFASDETVSLFNVTGLSGDWRRRPYH